MMIPSPLPADARVHWIAGREGGIGLCAAGGELLLLTGHPGRPDSNAFSLGTAAIDCLAARIESFRSRGTLDADGDPWPSVGWGDDDFPSLDP